MSNEPDNDLLDAGCDPDSPMGDIISDEDVDYLVLFASVLDDEDAIKEREQEWKDLFAEGVQA